MIGLDDWPWSARLHVQRLGHQDIVGRILDDDRVIPGEGDRRRVRDLLYCTDCVQIDYDLRAGGVRQLFKLCHGCPWKFEIPRIVADSIGLRWLIFWRCLGAWP
jgi:hypothetical protein